MKRLGARTLPSIRPYANGLPPPNQLLGAGLRGKASAAGPELCSVPRQQLGARPPQFTASVASRDRTPGTPEVCAGLGASGVQRAVCACVCMCVCCLRARGLAFRSVC